MENIQTQQDLLQSIAKLENQQLAYKNNITQHFRQTYEAIRPVNIIKDTVDDINNSDEIKKSILKAAIILAVGYLTKRLVERFILSTNNPITSKILTVLQIIVSGWVAKNGIFLKDIIMYFFRKILSKRLNQQQLAIGN